MRYWWIEIHPTPLLSFFIEKLKSKKTCKEYFLKPQVKRHRYIHMTHCLLKLKQASFIQEAYRSHSTLSIWTHFAYSLVLNFLSIPLRTQSRPSSPSACLHRNGSQRAKLIKNKWFLIIASFICTRHWFSIQPAIGIMQIRLNITPKIRDKRNVEFSYHVGLFWAVLQDV